MTSGTKSTSSTKDTENQTSPIDANQDKKNDMAFHIQSILDFTQTAKSHIQAAGSGTHEMQLVHLYSKEILDHAKHLAKMTKKD